MSTEWTEDGQGDDGERERAYERLSAAARRIGMPIERLHELLLQLENNETETRRLLAEDVYHVPDDLLDDLLRVRMKDLGGGAGAVE
jgi:hypothetical protein